MQHHRRLAFAFEHRAGHQQIAGRRARREHFSRGDAVSAVDFLRLAGTIEPVRSAAGDQLDALRRDPPQQRLDRRCFLMRPSPGRNGDLVRMHRKRQRGRSAMMGKCAQHRGQFVDSGAAAAKLRRHAGLEQAGAFQQGKIVGNEHVFVRCLHGALLEYRIRARARHRSECAAVPHLVLMASITLMIFFLRWNAHPRNAHPAPNVTGKPDPNQSTNCTAATCRLALVRC